MSPLPFLCVTNFVLIFLHGESIFVLHPHKFYFQRSSVPDSRGSTPCGCYEQGKTVHSSQATTLSINCGIRIRIT